ncbi:MAG: tetratricopeptide repeat protein [Anaerolineae bacterium]|nr:tetratricopeptide repeat protein [Gemmatimonadaceae bacterium]
MTLLSITRGVQPEHREPRRTNLAPGTRHQAPHSWRPEPRKSIAFFLAFESIHPSLRHALRASLSLFLLACACNRPARAQSIAEAEFALRAGRYDAAIAAFKSLAAVTDAPVAAHRGLLRALGEVGRYDEAEASGRGFVASHPQSAELWNTLGEILVQRGRITEATDAFTSAIAGHASDSVAARLNLAVLRYGRGERESAVRDFDWFIDFYNRGSRLTSAELTAIGTACRYLGLTDPALFKDALKAFDQAIVADSTNLEPRVRLGNLFLEKYNSADARTTFETALLINPRDPEALLGSARVRRFDGQPGADSLARQSLGVNPNYTDAHVFLATLRLEAENLDDASRSAQHALAIDSGSVAALAVLAATHHLRGEDPAFATVRRRALARDPRSAEIYITLAELSARNRFYKKAVGFAREGVSIDSTSTRSYALLGINELRTGAIAAARTHLEKAFAGDPYDVWTKNTLDLLDTFKDYRETRTERFLFVIDGKESALLSLYLGDLAGEAYGKLAARYDYRPATPVRLELYRSHADFSVRTVGLAGLGALGVAFGNVLAMDSPSARETGQFNWGSTFWHELAHTFTLGVTDHRVPRWLSEGLSVLEERRARPGWGAGPSVGFLAAYKAGRLLPVSRLNEGFMTPAYPEQVIFSYYQASLVCEMIERDGGISAIRSMLKGYRDGLTTAEVVKGVLGTDQTALDKKFDRYFRERFSKPLAAIRISAASDSGDATVRRRVTQLDAMRDPGDFVAQLSAGRTLLDEGKTDDAITHLERAKALFPEYAGPNSPYALLARIHTEKGAPRRAADELTRLTELDENAYAANVELAKLLEQLGDSRGSSAALERAIYINPYDIDLHTRLATLYDALGDNRLSLRERRAIVALAPVDMAEAQYQLALAYRKSGDHGNARRSVLEALELAPNFAKAQELLLDLQDNGSKADRRGKPL